MTWRDLKDKLREYDDNILDDYDVTVFLSETGEFLPVLELEFPAEDSFDVLDSDNLVLRIDY